MKGSSVTGAKVRQWAASQHLSAGRATTLDDFYITNLHLTYYSMQLQRTVSVCKG